MQQEVNQTQEQNKKVIGTSDMPAPQTMEYRVVYKVTDLFIRDLTTVLKNGPYVELKGVLNFIESNERKFTAAVLNEFIRMLGNFPYKSIMPLMKAIENKDKFSYYFEIVKPD